jgi:hypothetical protein
MKTKLQVSGYRIRVIERSVTGYRVPVSGAKFLEKPIICSVIEIRVLVTGNW